MDISAKKLARLMRPDQPIEVRGSAVVVAAELGVKDPEIAAELLERLSDESDAVRIQAIKAAGKLKITKALPVLLERVTLGGEEAKLSAEAAAKLGAEAVRKLQDLMNTVSPGLRRVVAVALTGAGGAAADAGVRVLVDKDPQVAAASASALAGRIPNMPADQKAKLARELVTLLSDKKARLTPQAELPVIKVLAALHDPEAADVLWDRAMPPYTPEVRAAALAAVGGMATESPTKEQMRRLFACAAEPTFAVAAPALLALSKLPVTDKALPDWLKLFDAPDVAARKLALEKVGDRDTPEVADAILSQMDHHDRNIGDLARKKLSKLTHGRDRLGKALLDAADADEAWQLARSVAPFAGEFPPKSQEAIFAAAAKYTVAADHRADALLFLLKEIDAGGLRDRLFDHAVNLRKKKDYEGALKFLKVLTRDPASGYPIRLEAAMCGLKRSAKEISTDSRANDPCLRLFEQTLGQHAAETVKTIEKAKWLDESDLFYAGFHFVERLGTEKEFGASLLKLVVKQWPKSKPAAAAKNKLKSAGAE
jgi:HEAT repeat protein